MNGTLPQTVQGEITKQYPINIEEQDIKARSNQFQSNPNKSDAIGLIKNIALKVRLAVVTSIITITVLLIAQNIAVVILDGGRWIDNNLVM